MPVSTRGKKRGSMNMEERNGSVMKKQKKRGRNSKRGRIQRDTGVKRSKRLKKDSCSSSNKLPRLARIKSSQVDTEEAERSPHLSIHSAAKELLRRKHYKDFLDGEDLSYMLAYKREIEEDVREVEAAITLQKRWRGLKGRDTVSTLKFRREQLEKKRARLFERSFFRAFGLTGLVLSLEIFPIFLILSEKTDHIPDFDNSICIAIVACFAMMIRFSHMFVCVLGEGSTAAPILASFIAFAFSTLCIFTYTLLTIIAKDFIARHASMYLLIYPLLSVVVGVILGCIWRFQTVSRWTYQHIPHKTQLVTDEFLDSLDTGDIVFHSGEDYLSKLIKFFTGAHACHVGVIVRDPSRRVRKAYGLKMPQKELVDATSSRKVRGKGKKRRRRKNKRGVKTTKERIFVLETVFGRRGHAVEMMSLRDWIREYARSDGENYTCFVRHLLLPDHEYIHAHHPLDDLLMPLRRSEYEPNFLSIVYSVLRLQVQSSMKHIFCSELVGAVRDTVFLFSFVVFPLFN